MRVLKRFTSRTPNFAATGAMASTVDTSPQQRAGRFRSPGDGQIDFKGVFSKLTEYDFAGWAVLEWECCLKDSETGAREGSEFIRRHIIPVAGRAFDDLAAGGGSNMIQVAIIGAGFIGPAHLESCGGWEMSRWWRCATAALRRRSARRER